MDQLSWKERKEQFVTGLNGTTVFEVFVIISFFPAFWLVRALCLNWVPRFFSRYKFFLFVVDFLLLIVSFLLAVTELVDISTKVLLAVVLFCVSALVVLKKSSKTIDEEKENNASFVMFSDNAVSDILSDDDSFEDKNNTGKKSMKFKDKKTPTDVIPRKMPFINAFRASVNIATCICILAVDFHVFPRRLAKTEDFGSGLMDVGTGMYIVANAMVSLEARFPHKRQINHAYFDALTSQILSSWPLILIGLIRMVSVKILGYNEHISEYGMHWNFFLSLACVKNTAAVISFFTKAKYSLLISIVIAVSYQFVLVSPWFNATDILLNNDRNGILLQNKEGLASCIGLLSLYFAGVFLGAYLFKPRCTLQGWVRASINLFLVYLALCYSLYNCDSLIQPISRRMANLAYILWILALSIFVILMFIISHIVIAWYISKSWLSSRTMPDQWIALPPDKASEHMDFSPPPPSLCIFSAITRNSLFYFLICNLTTGVVNGLIDTMSVGKVFAIAILVGYQFAITLLIWILHIKQITLRYW